MIQLLVPALSLWVLVHSAMVAGFAYRAVPQPADVIVVFGNHVGSDGAPSPRLRARLERAIELYEQGYAPRILASGGIDSDGTREGYWMKRYLVNRGVPESAVIADDSGTNTRATAAAAHAHGFERVLLVSQYHHLLRADLAFRQIGFRSVSVAAADYIELRDGYSMMREWLAWYWYRLSGEG
jgi:uncharacterized SAM-binding protein YcdF (DUF218 family)